MAGSRIRLYGSTSGYVELAAPAVSPDAVITLPPTLAGIGTNVVQATKTDTFSTASTSYTLVTGLEVTITPTSSASKILVVANIQLGGILGGQSGVIRRGGTILIQGDTAGSRRRASFGTRLESGDLDEIMGYTFVYLDSPATTSATTYDVAITTGNAGRTAYINRSDRDTDGIEYPRTASTLTAIEVAA